MVKRILFTIALIALLAPFAIRVENYFYLKKKKVRSVPLGNVLA